MANLFGWGARKESAVEKTAPAPPADQVCASIVLPKFLSAVSQVNTPTILDLGPVVGSNVAFLGDHLGCKLLIGDLHRDLDTEGISADEARERIMARLKSTVVAPVHGILCWDVFDFLNRPTAQALGAFLTGMLAPGGVVHGFFGTTQGELDALQPVCAPVASIAGMPPRAGKTREADRAADARPHGHVRRPDDGRVGAPEVPAARNSAPQALTHERSGVN